MSSRRRNVRARQTVIALIAAFMLGSLTVNLIPGEQPSGIVSANDLHESKNKLLPVSVAEIKSGGDWAQWGGNSYRNNTPVGVDICRGTAAASTVGPVNGSVTMRRTSNGSLA